MDTFYSRSEALLGQQTMDVLRSKRVILFGVGGVGSFAAEALIRTGLTHLIIVDDDSIQPSNINRQLQATGNTVGRPKVEVLRERLLTINPEAEITALQERYTPDEAESAGLRSHVSHCDYLIDAIDDVAAKTDLIIRASRVRGLKIYSSMGAALRFDPTQVSTGELMSIQGDALAKAVRARMKKLDVKPSRKIRCVYSTEQAKSCESRGSLMQVTAVFGLTLASLVINDIYKQFK